MAKSVLHDAILKRLTPTISLYAIVKELYQGGQAPYGASPLQNGGGERDRTDDPLRARQVLSQLSYTPIFENRENR